MLRFGRLSRDRLRRPSRAAWVAALVLAVAAPAAVPAAAPVPAPVPAKTLHPHPASRHAGAAHHAARHGAAQSRAAASGRPAPPQTALDAAPVPDRDIDPPVVRADEQPRVTPKLFDLRTQRTGDGYVYGSSFSGDEDSMRLRVPGVNLTVPLH